MITVKEWYISNYPTDDMGEGINPKATFVGLLNELFVGRDVSEYLYVYDSIIRERLFQKLADELGFGYEYVHKLWYNI